MKKIINWLLAKPSFAHLIRAANRYNQRNGPLFAAAVTYFSALSLVPILMFIFSVTGIVITLLMPDLLESIKLSIINALGNSNLAEMIRPLVDDFLHGLGSAGLIALGISLWTGTSWMGNLRKAVQFQLNEDIIEDESGTNIVKSTLSNAGIFIIFTIVTIASFVVTSFSMLFNKYLVGWLGLKATMLANIFVGVTVVVISIIAATLLFLYLFWALAGNKLPVREWLLGSLMAGIGLIGLQSLAGLVTAMFRNNMSAKLFGPIIVLMLFFNLYATLIMFTAAWIGTTNAELKDNNVVADKPQLAEPKLVRGPFPDRAIGIRMDADEMLDSVVAPNPNILIPQTVAVRGVKVGTAIGYGLGAATGLGLGALLISLVKGLFKKSPRANH